MKKNKIYVGKTKKDIGNNQSFCKVDEKELTSNLEFNIEEKLDKLFNTNGYVFNIKVKIITDSKTYNTQVASRVGNSIITLDNDIININEIKDIIF